MRISAGPPEKAVIYSSRSGVEQQKDSAHRPASSGRAVSRGGEIDSGRHLQALRRNLVELGVPEHVASDWPQAQDIVLNMRPCGVEGISHSTALKTDHRGRRVCASHRSSRSVLTQFPRNSVPSASWSRLTSSPCRKSWREFSMWRWTGPCSMS